VITRITGELTQLGLEAVTLAVGAFDYEVLVPEFVRRQLQSRVGETISLHTLDFIDGNPQQGKLVPRLIGFQSPVEREFFEAFCSVDGVGTKKALRAMGLPVRDVATAIEEQDVKLLATLPGIGPAMAERIVAKLRRKMARFALLIAQSQPVMAEQAAGLFEETYQILLTLGHSPADARKQLEEVLATKKKYKSHEELIQEIYQHQRP